MTTLTAIHRRVALLKQRSDATVIGRVPSGYWVMGEVQIRLGYTLLLPDPVVSDIGALTDQARDQFMHDWGQLSVISQAVTNAVRVNLAIFGNVEPALHAHLIPRYREESATESVLQPWALDWESAPRFSQAIHQPLVELLQAEATKRFSDWFVKDFSTR